jgi:hypothetical protein
MFEKDLGFRLGILVPDMGDSMDMSFPIMTMYIGIEISQNNIHWLMALFFIYLG